MKKILGFRFLSLSQQILIKNFLQYHGASISRRQDCANPSSYSYILEDDEDLIKYIIGDNGAMWEVNYTSDNNNILSVTVTATKFKAKYITSKFSIDEDKKSENRTDEVYIDYINSRMTELTNLVNNNPVKKKKTRFEWEKEKQLKKKLAKENKDNNLQDETKSDSEAEIKIKYLKKIKSQPPIMVVNLDSDTNSCFIMTGKEYGKKNWDLKEKLKQEFSDKLDEMNVRAIKHHIRRHCKVIRIKDNVNTENGSNSQESTSTYQIELDHVPIFTTTKSNKSNNSSCAINNKKAKSNIEKDLEKVLVNSFKEYNNQYSNQILVQEFLAFLLVMREVCGANRNLGRNGVKAGWTANKAEIMEKINNRLEINVVTTDKRKKQSWEIQNEEVAGKWRIDEDAHDNSNITQEEYERKLEKKLDRVSRIIQKTALKYGIHTNEGRCYRDEIGNKVDDGARAHKIIVALSVSALNGFSEKINYLNK